jgi:hypothetical protein
VYKRPWLSVQKGVHFSANKKITEKRGKRKGKGKREKRGKRKEGKEGEKRGKGKETRRN